MNDQSHSDYYDRQTVDECRRMVESERDRLAEIEDTDPDADEKRRTIQAAYRVAIYFNAGDRALKKQETIGKWAEDAVNREAKKLKKQKLLDAVRPRSDIHCLRCSKLMRFEMKDTYDLDEERDRIILFYACPDGCLPKRAFFDDGTEYRPKPVHCEQCKAVVTKSESKREGNVITTSYQCVSCGNANTDSIDLTPRNEETYIDEQFAEDRDKYCLTDEATGKYRSEQQNIKQLGELVDRMKIKEVDHQFEDRLKAVRTMKAAELGALLIPVLQTASFVSLELANPTIAKEVRVKFTIQDVDSVRSEHDAVRAFMVSVEHAIIETNWRLVKGTIAYTLGILTGEFRGYRNETEMRQLFEKEKQRTTAENHSVETPSQMPNSESQLSQITL